VPPSLSSFAARLTELTETFGGHEFSASTARQLLATFDQDYADFEKFLVRRFPRLEEGQQHLLIEILMQAQATAYASLLQQWSRERALPLSIRAHALRAQESLGVQGDTAYRDALWHAEAIYTALSQATPSPLTDTGELLPTWCQAVLDLPLALAVDLAHALSPAQPQIALAVVQSLRPIVDAKDRLALIECLAEMTIPESVTVLLDFLRDTTDKALQKTIKRALHRLKAQGLTVDSDVQRPHTAMVGTVTHRLEKCRQPY
jgi:hypothetical protein